MNIQDQADSHESKLSKSAVLPLQRAWSSPAPPGLTSASTPSSSPCGRQLPSSSPRPIRFPQCAWSRRPRPAATRHSANRFRWGGWWGISRLHPTQILDPGSEADCKIRLVTIRLILHFKYVLCRHRCKCNFLYSIMFIIATEIVNLTTPIDSGILVTDHLLLQSSIVNDFTV